jgi:paraquat-inducible protein B
MPDTENINPTVPQAKVASKKKTRISFVWIIPLVAAVVGVWIAVTTIRNQGPTITIVFKDAEGLEANKTMIRYNGLEMGEITSVELSPDYQSVIATAKMHPKTEAFLHKDTQFWVVRPQISGANVSGLSTLISGAYIGMDINTSKEPERNFKALDDAPLEIGGIRGQFYTLTTPELGSLTKGTPIFFRRLQAGQVASYELDKSGKFLNVKIFVQEPYDKFVTSDTRFWHASGVEMSLSATGLRVRTQSVLSILIGGIAFETPEASIELPPAAENSTFALADDHDAAFRPPPVNPLTFTIVFTEPLRGLNVGAPVELNGITIGEVTEIHAQFDLQTHDFSAPVTIVVDPARYGVDFLKMPPGVTNLVGYQHSTLDDFVARGLRAQLKTGSLITGSQLVALEFFPNAKPATLDWSHTPLQLPTQPGTLNTLENGVSDLIAKVNQIPFKDIGNNLNSTLIGAQGAITNANLVLKNSGQMVAPGSLLDAQLNATLREVGGAAQAMRILADYLERHPEAILQGKPADPK